MKIEEIFSGDLGKILMIVGAVLILAVVLGLVFSGRNKKTKIAKCKKCGTKIDEINWEVVESYVTGYGRESEGSAVVKFFWYCPKCGKYDCETVTFSLGKGVSNYKSVKHLADDYTRDLLGLEH